MPPLVTIGIPCYNSADWVGVAVESALEQSHAPTEVVVVDDGSTDGSADAVSRFGDRVRLVRQPNGGANSARNRILEEARGEWIQYLDADDYLLPGKIEQQFAEAEDPLSADILYSPTYEENWKSGDARERRIIAIDPALDLHEQWILWQLPQTDGALWRRDAVRKLGGWDETIPTCHEHNLYLRAIQAGMRFAYTPTPGSVYRIWSENTICRKDPLTTIEQKSSLILEMLEWLETRGVREKRHREAAGQAYFEMARTIAKYDLSKAAAYHDHWKRRGLMTPRGPAAPIRYRLAYRLFGFRMAERVASGVRNGGGADG